MAIKKSNDWFQKEVKKIYGSSVSFIDDYVGAKTKINFHCNMCDNDFIQYPDSLLHNHGCPKCAHKKRIKNKSLTNENFQKRLDKKFCGNINCLDKYINNYTKIKFVCSKCKKIFYTTPQSILNSKFGCPECAKKYQGKPISKFSIEDVVKIFEDENCELLSKNYKNARIKLKYRCSCGNISEIALKHFLDGKRCYSCKFERISKKTKGRKINNSLSEEERNRKRNLTGWWSKKIKENANFICEKCKIKGSRMDGKMVAHHLESYKWNKELVNDLKNGICLCKDCHNKFHSIYGQGKKQANTSEQMKEFLCQ